MPNELQGLLGGMQATPRNKLMGLLADGLKAADRYANKPDPTMPGGKANPPLSLLSDLASLKSLAEVANNVSYGYPLTNAGVANVPFLKPETADALMMAPISPRNALAAAALAGGGDTAAMKAIFAGIGAKTADKAALARAEKLAASGADTKAIWRDTGWFKGGDGKWRFEIDDSQAMFNPSGIGAAKKENDLTIGYPGMDLGPSVGNLIEHPSLKDAYGGVTKSTFIGNKNTLFGDGVQGSYSDGVLQVNAPAKAADAKSTTLHELQHAVQQREGFAKGGSAEGMKPLMAERADLQQKFATALEQFRTTTDEVAKGNALQQMNFYGVRLGKMPKADSAEDAYLKLAGEAEARAVQSRMNLNQQQRRELFPLDSFDVPANSLIYR